MPIQQLKEAGYEIPSLQADGGIHRFNRNQDDKKKCAWYIAYLNHSRQGEPFYVVLYGDWREGSVNKICTLKNASGDDNAFIKEHFEKAVKAREAAQKIVWDEAAKEAEAAWPCFDLAGESEYLKRKKIKNYGLRFQGDILIIPIHDNNKKLWGFQRINADGSKYFTVNAKVSGNYYLIGEIKSEALVCEGYATGATLHEATGLPVLVAFNAGNLAPVCLQFPDVTLTVCGDEDAFKKENVGRKKALACAAERIIFPEFESQDGEPTDFNDLYIREGIERVKEQVLNEEVQRQFVLCLGHRDKTYYYTSSSNKRIVEISREGHNRSNLRDLMPEAYWEAKYPGKQGANYDAAADALMQKCRAKGIFEETSVKGVGVWRERDTYLINLGDGLYFNGKRHALDAMKGDAIYEIGPRIPEPRALDCDPTLILRILENVSWKRPDSAKFLAGWLVVAPIAGALAWRPHIWLTGGAGTGKSTIMNSVIRPLVPSCHYFLGNTTEAGMRQTTRNDSKAVICDEFETEDEKSGHRIRAILEFMRQASSETEGMVAKGSAGGQALSFRPRFAALVSSIRVGLVHEADRMRFNELELERGKDEAFDEFKKLSCLIDERYSLAMFSRTFRMLPVLMESIANLWEVIRMRYTARIGQQYGALLAGYWLLEHEEAITLDEAHRLLNSLALDEVKQSMKDKEETECIEHLGSKILQLDHGAKKSVAELAESGTAPEVLARYGIKTEGEFLWIATKHAELSMLFKGTKWETGWGKSLARLEGAEKASVHIGSKTVYAVKIRSEIMFDKASMF